MAGISRTLRQSMLNAFFSITAWTPPTAIYVALYSVPPSAIGGGTELVGDGYTRIQHTAWHSATAAEPSVVTNNGTITFPTATANWLTITAAGYFDTMTAGTFCGYASVTAKYVQSGDVLQIADTKLSTRLNETA